MGNQQPGNVKLGEKLGEGSYGEVYKGTWKGRPVALKKLRGYLFEGYDFRNMREDVFKNYEKEWKILSTLSHRNIVEYYDVILNEEGKVPPIIVTELCDCDLNSFIRVESNRRVAFPDIVSIMSDIAEGLKYLHGHHPEPIVHRDLSSKNILLTKHKQAKITDFGLSKAFPNGAMYATAGVGCMLYAAPETYPLKTSTGRFAQKAYYTEKIDIFSFGAVLLEVIIGRLPKGPLINPLLDDGEVVPEHIRRSEEIDEMGSDHPLHKLVMICLDNLPEDRPNAQGLIDFLARFKSDKEGIDIQRKAVSMSSLKESPPMYSSVMRVTKNNYDYNFKVAVLGNSNVGKTSIIQRFLHPGRPGMSHSLCTIQAADYFERLQYRGKSVHLHIVDTPGNTGYHSVTNVVPQIYRGVDGVVIVFDVADRDSFNNVVDWLTTVHDRSGREIVVVLVGNKTDLQRDLWKVSSEKAQAFASANDLFYIETSATGLINIDEIFSVLIDRMVHEKLLYSPGTSNAGSPQVDWVFYQSPHKSLLKEDHSIRSLPTITGRAKADPLSTDNIKIGHSANESINSKTTSNGSARRRSWCPSCF